MCKVIVSSNKQETISAVQEKSNNPFDDEGENDDIIQDVVSWSKAATASMEKMPTEMKPTEQSDYCTVFAHPPPT